MLKKDRHLDDVNYLNAYIRMPATTSYKVEW